MKPEDWLTVTATYEERRYVGDTLLGASGGPNLRRCPRCGATVDRNVTGNHDQWHDRLDALFAAMERAHTTSWQLQVMLFVGVISALIIGVVAL